MKIYTEYSLKNFTTFQVEAIAENFYEIESELDIIELCMNKFFQKNEFLIIGGGSNLLLQKDRYENIILIATSGKKIIEDLDDSVIIKVSAGEERHSFVEYCAKNNWYGVENLALIPGSVGAAPVQNIGAYGVEVKDVIVKVEGINLESGRTEIIQAAQCEFGYRDSVFKRERKGKFIIMSVFFKLSKVRKVELSYHGIQQKLGEKGLNENDVDAIQIVEIVSELRKSKLPDWKVLGTAGSFFHNPIVDMKTFIELQKKLPDIVSYELDNGMIKLSAGWLIETAGLKGYRIGDAGVFEKHALVLVNYGNATGQEITELATYIEQKVYELSGVSIKPEVNII